MKYERKVGNWKHGAVVLAMLGIAPSGLLSQERYELDKRVQPPLRLAALGLLDSAVRDSLPTTPLVDKLLEGVSKGAEDAKVLLATQKVYGHLQTARKTLGRVPEPDLISAAAVLRAGAPPKTLSTIQRALPRRSLAVPFSVLSVMLNQKVPLGEATRAVIAKSRISDDKTLLALGQSVEKSIADGLPPRTALIHAERSIKPRGHFGE